MSRRQIAWLAPFALAIVASANGGLAASAEADQQVVATIYAPGSAPVQDAIGVGQLASGCPRYTGPNIELYRSGGTQVAGQQVTNQAWALGTLLGCLQSPVPLSAVKGIIITSPNGPETGSNSELTPPDLATPSDFANPNESPVIYNDGSGGLIYARPWRGTSSDANFGDGFTAQAPNPLGFEVFEGQLLHVSVRASSAAVSAGGRVAFSATITGQPAGTPVSYSWSFDGGAPDSRAAAPSVTFRAPGVFRIMLQVTDREGGGGGATIPLTVNQASGTPPPARKHAPPTGPATSLGTSPGASAGERPVRGASPPAGRQGTSAGAGSPPTATSPSTAGAHHGRGRPGRARPARATRPPSSGAQAAPAGRLVAGRLIANVVPVPAGAGPLVRRVRPTGAAPALGRSAGASALPALAGAAGALVMFCLGAGREMWRRRLALSLSR